MTKNQNIKLISYFDLGNPNLDIRQSIEKVKEIRKRINICFECGVFLNQNQKSMFCTECLINVYDL